MSRASAFTPQHAQQMHALRQWARKQGKTPPAVLNKDLQQALAQDADHAPATLLPPSTHDGNPAPDSPSSEGAD